MFGILRENDFFAMIWQLGMLVNAFRAVGRYLNVPAAFDAFISVLCSTGRAKMRLDLGKGIAAFYTAVSFASKSARTAKVCHRSCKRLTADDAFFVIVAKSARITQFCICTHCVFSLPLSLTEIYNIEVFYCLFKF